jgi:hypothetical protein
MVIIAIKNGADDPTRTDDLLITRKTWGNVKKCSAMSCVKMTLAMTVLQNLLEPIGDIPPAEFEAMYYEGQEGSAREAGIN